jgi:hypothetical protein
MRRIFLNNQKIENCRARDRAAARPDFGNARRERQKNAAMIRASFIPSTRSEAGAARSEPGPEQQRTTQIEKIEKWGPSTHRTSWLNADAIRRLNFGVCLPYVLKFVKRLGGLGDPGFPAMR